MAMSVLQVKVSVMDTEPMNDLISIICGWDRDKPPVEYKDQLEGWADKFLDGEPDEPAKVGKDQQLAEAARSASTED
ncbi:hypothetical protein JNZ24_10785 [Streptococcus suis]|uniref:hypothetical protein n=1 Tax=Streptococcus suis TaxID=1307 RepID=UPI00193408B7|nr:hypothetical protein [Streptococcus suis]MBM0273902.1 hypothetical protein [Streptococcus suis]